MVLFVACAAMLHYSGTRRAVGDDSGAHSSRLLIIRATCVTTDTGLEVLWSNVALPGTEKICCRSTCFSSKLDEGCEEKIKRTLKTADEPPGTPKRGFLTTTEHVRYHGVQNCRRIEVSYLLKTSCICSNIEFTHGITMKCPPRESLNASLRSLRRGALFLMVAIRRVRETALLETDAGEY